MTNLSETGFFVNEHLVSLWMSTDNRNVVVAPKCSAENVMIYEAIIFDFDGLILDTEGCDFAGWESLYREHGFVLPYERYQGTVGAITGRGSFDPYADFEKHLGGRVDWSILEPRRLEYTMSLIASQPLMPGVEDYLRTAKSLGLRIGLASSSEHDWVETHLKRLHVFPYFETIQCAEDVVETKPAPDLYLAALAALNVSAKHALAFEDSIYGLTAAKRAGMTCVAVPSRRSQNDCFGEADLCLDSLASLGLEELLKRLNHG
jgi:HAD superfamily hydrolase (TIGR01509 family)